MKNVITVFLLMSFSSAFAGEKLLCDVKKTDQTLLLEQSDALAISDEERELGIDKKWVYSAELQTTELPFPNTYSGIAIEADVKFDFTSNDGRLSVELYLDDMAGSLTLDGEVLEVTNCKTLQGNIEIRLTIRNEQFTYLHPLNIRLSSVQLQMMRADSYLGGRKFLSSMKIGFAVLPVWLLKIMELE